MTVLRAHFDGKSFIPDDPVDLPNGQAVELHIHELTDSESSEDHLVVIENGLPVIISPRGSKPITSEDVKRAEDELP